MNVWFVESDPTIAALAWAAFELLEVQYGVVIHCGLVCRIVLVFVVTAGFCIFFVDPDMFPLGCGFMEVAAMLGE